MRGAGRGLLRRRPVTAASLRYIGKESNRIDDVKAGRISELEEVLNEYRNTDREWAEPVQWVLRQVSKAQLSDETGIHERTIAANRNGRPPHPKNRILLIRSAGAFARKELKRRGQSAPLDDLDACEVLYALVVRARSPGL